MLAVVFLKDDGSALETAEKGDVFVDGFATVDEFSIFHLASGEGRVIRLVGGGIGGAPRDEVVRNVMPERPFAGRVEIHSAFLAVKALLGFVDEGVEVSKIKIRAVFGVGGRKEGLVRLAHDQVLVAHQKEVVRKPANQENRQRRLFESENCQEPGHEQREKPQYFYDRNVSKLMAVKQVDGRRLEKFGLENRGKLVDETRLRRTDV